MISVQEIRSNDNALMHGNWSQRQRSGRRDGVARRINSGIRGALEPLVDFDGSAFVGVDVRS